MFKTRFCVAGIVLSGAMVAAANSFNIGDTLTVAEASVNPSDIVNVTITGPTLNYSGGAYAGINQLLINGSQTVNGFCIDPFHFSSTTPLNYTVVSLANAPKQDPFSATGMGGAEALTIERLWAAHYSSGMSADNAATLQLAIWDVVGGTDFSTTSSLNSTAESWISTVNANGYNGAAADLVGLTGSGQDYVVQNVPDGGTTILLLGSACFGVALLRSRIRPANHVCGNE